MNERYLYKYSYAGHYNVAVCYPNSYHIGMSNLGFLSLFHFLSSTDGIRVFRYFIERDGKLFSPEYSSRKANVKSGGGCSLSDFDAVFFSVSFEMDYLNIVRMLRLSELNPVSKNRKISSPIVITGGIAVTANPRPISVISDVVYRGDMEVGLPDLLKYLFEQKFRKSEKLFHRISRIPGFLIKEIELSSFKRAVEKDISAPAHSVIITDNTVFANRFLVEIARGCKNSCKFCMARTSNSPPRSIPKDSIFQVAVMAKRYTGLVGLVAPVVNDNPELIEIVNELNKNKMLVSFSSLRADRFTEELAELIRINRQKSITFAPETGSDSLRKKIGKQLKNDQILGSVGISIRSGIKNIRYYFMYGLPFERWGDIESIIELVNNTIKIIDNNGSLHLSINPFIPKKNTPFEDEEVLDFDYYSSVKAYLFESINKIKKRNNISLRFESLKSLYTHYFLSKGNEKTGNFLADNSFDKSIGQIEKHFKKLYESGVNPDEY